MNFIFCISPADSNDIDTSTHGNFCLLDSATQIPVLSCKIPDDWCGGGKTTWNSEPSQPVSWYIWFMSPDGLSRVAMNSEFTVMSYGTIEQAQLNGISIFENPENLAQIFLPVLAKDYALPNLEILKAEFKDASKTPEGISYLEKYPSIGSKIGIMTVTNRILLDCGFRYSGFKNGNKFNVLFGFGVHAFELQSAAVKTVMINFFPAMSCGFVENNEDNVKKIMESIFHSLKMNPGFTLFVNQIISKRTEDWLTTQQEIRKIQEEVFKGTSKTQSEIFSKWNEYISDVDIVTDPSSGQRVAIDSRFDHARIASDGSILYYNDGFNPNENSLEFDPNLNPNFNSHGITWGQDLKH